MNIPFEQPGSFGPYESRPTPDHVLERARALSDNATANGMSMNFDRALGHAVALDAADRLPILPLLGETCLQGLEPSAIYWLAEALDVAMEHDPDEARRYNAAAMVVDLQATLYGLTGANADARSRILINIFKIDGQSPVAQQLAERYFSANSDLEREVVGAVIVSHSRTAMTPGPDLT